MEARIRNPLIIAPPFRGSQGVRFGSQASAGTAASTALDTLWNHISDMGSSCVSLKIPVSLKYTSQEKPNSIWNPRWEESRKWFWAFLTLRKTKACSEKVDVDIVLIESCYRVNHRMFLGAAGTDINGKGLARWWRWGLYSRQRRGNKDTQKWVSIN